MTDNGHQEPTLDLDALVEPMGDFKIGGRRYDYRSWLSFGLLDQKQIGKRYNRALELSAAEDITPAEEEEHHELVFGMIEQLTSMPRDAASEQKLDRLETALAGFFILRGRSIDEATLALLKMRKDLIPAIEPATTGTLSSDSIDAGRKATR